MIDPRQAANLLVLVQTTVDYTEWPVLGVKTVDLLVLVLIGSASCAIMQAQWAVLRDLLAKGKTRALGTYILYSSYCQFLLDCILATTKNLLHSIIIILCDMLVWDPMIHQVLFNMMK